jgi:nitronate monooxygenase
MMMLGAAGVLLGTRFYASQEADGAEEAKKRICAAKAGSTTRGLIFDISRDHVWPAPFTGRCLINDHARCWAGRELELLQDKRASAEYMAARAARNFDIAAVIAGEAVGLIHDVPPAAEIVDRIVAEADQILLGRRNSSSASRGRTAAFSTSSRPNFPSCRRRWPGSWTRTWRSPPRRPERWARCLVR